MVSAFEQANNCAVPYVIDPRRPGDVAECYADVTKAQRELNWKAHFTLREMCEDAWRWQKYQMGCS
jgi:UDP-glucose 4-epimerase